MSDEWISAATVGTEEEAALIAGFLDSEGINAVVESRRFNQEPVNFGNLAQVEVMVPAADAERAAELLEQANSAPSEDE
jgi:hypothetical protein